MKYKRKEYKEAGKCNQCRHAIPTDNLKTCQACLGKLKVYRRSNPKKVSDNQKRWKYGLTREELQKMADESQGECALCRRFDDKGLTIDHDHVTGRVRQMLCHSCNHALGLLADDPDLCRRAAEYITYYRNGADTHERKIIPMEGHA